MCHFGMFSNFKSYNMECEARHLYMLYTVYKNLGKKKILVTFINTSFQRGMPVFLLMYRNINVIKATNNVEF